MIVPESASAKKVQSVVKRKIIVIVGEKPKVGTPSVWTLMSQSTWLTGSTSWIY